MAKATQAELDAIPLSRRGKLFKWFKYYTDESNSVTFLNKAESARAAKYRTNSNASITSIGNQNFRKLQSKLTTWFDHIGLSDNRLRAKMVSLLSAKEIKFFQYEGVVTDQREVEALETQRRTLDMALKVKGAYAQAGPPVQVNLQVNVNRLGEALRSEIEHKSRAITDLESDPLD